MALQRLYSKLAPKDQTSSSEMLRIDVDEARQLKLSSQQAIHVVTGGAWVSFKGEDHVVNEGDDLAIQRDRNGVVISPLGDEPVTFAVIKSDHFESN